MVVCAFDVCRCNLEHHWIETGEERNQYHMEPMTPVMSLEAWEKGADEGEGSIHHNISHGRLNMRELPKHNMRGL